MFAQIETPVFLDHHMVNQVTVCSPYIQQPPIPPEQIMAATLQSGSLNGISGTIFNAEIQIGFSNGSSRVPFCDTTAYKVEQLRLAAKITEAKREWSRYLLDPKSSVDVDQISETVDHLYDAVFEYGPAAIDLRGLFPDAVNGEHLAAILRATSAWSNSVLGWTPALKVAEQALRLNKQNPYDALVGLVVHNE